MREAARACFCPYPGLRATPTGKNASPSGSIGKIERVGPEIGQGLAPDALSGAIKGFQGES